MLRVSVHSGTPDKRSIHNELMSVDIAYESQKAMANYWVSLQVRSNDARVAALTSYPRWSASLWDLAARAIATALYGTEPVPPAVKPDRRCAYATQVCVVIENVELDHREQLLAVATIAQAPGHRGRYLAQFSEDILGDMTAQFDYGAKRMDYADFVLRAMCWALFGKDTLGPRTKLILPTTVSVDGEDVFDIEGLAEPAKTGFRRYLAKRLPTARPADLAKAEDYVSFLFNKG